MGLENQFMVLVLNGRLRQVLLYIQKEMDCELLGSKLTICRLCCTLVPEDSSLS